MTTLTKTLLAASIAGFIAGSIIDFGGLNLNPAWTVALPLGAVFFGLSLISFMLEKEMAKFDAEEALKTQLTPCQPVAPAVKEKSFPNPSLQFLHDH
jgi:hypothetical protein